MVRQGKMLVMCGYGPTTRVVVVYYTTLIARNVTSLQPNTPHVNTTAELADIKTEQTIRSDV